MLLHVALCLDGTQADDGRMGRKSLSPPSSFNSMLCAAWPTHWANKLLLVCGLSSKVTLDDLRPMFPGAEEIVIVANPLTTLPYRPKDHAAKARADNG